MKENSTELMDNLSDKLTRKQLLRFIKMARPEIKSHYAELMDMLKQQQWSQAKAQAHKFKTSISLFSYAELVLSLDEIEAKNIELIDTSAFQHNLEQHYQSLLTAIDAFINNHSVALTIFQYKS